MILLINTCSEKLHYFEFVKPIEEIVQDSKEKFFTKHYLDLNINDLEKANKVIICGTALKDFSYLDNIRDFLWIRGFNKPLLGICAGLQVIVKIFDGILEEEKEIGLTQFIFKKDFLGIKKQEKIEVYNLHKQGISKLNEIFDICAKSKKGIQAIKHKEKEIYGVMFHPEARNREIVKNFCLKNKKEK